MPKILLIEDDHDLADMIDEWLGFEHHSVEQMHHGIDGLNLLLSTPFDLLILDWELPGISGVEICRRYRDKGGNIPVLMLTGKSSISDKERGLDAGADDYLTKPFHVRELCARVRALMRRTQVAASNKLAAGDLTLDPQSYCLMKGTEELQLPPKEFALLEFLMRHPKQIFSQEALLDRVWKSEEDVSVEAVRACMKRLRQKITNADGTCLIRTIHGAGYKLEE